MFNYTMSVYTMSVAAFGFVAFVLAFVHPASQAGRAAAQQVAVAGSIVAASAAPADGRPHLAPSK